MTLIRKLDLRDKRNVYVVGDIHGCYSLLQTKLNIRGFDEQQDALISVGDLVDRGPENEQVFEWLDKPWFFPVRGNHEEMCRPEFAGTSWHVSNGGGWVFAARDNMGTLELERQLKRLYELPLAIEALVGDKRFGFIHASLYDVTDWNDLEEQLARYEKYDENPFVWDRYHIGSAKKLSMYDPRNEGEGSAFVVKNIDKVFFGHTPLKEPFQYGNCVWIDTGAFATNNLTVLKVE